MRRVCFCRRAMQVSGFVVAVLGSKTKKGKLAVEDICFTDVLAQPQHPIPQNDVYVCIVSGLSLGDEVANPLHVELLSETLKGASLASSTDNVRIAHTIIAGTVLHAVPRDRHHGRDTHCADAARRHSRTGNSVCKAQHGSYGGAYLKDHKAIDQKAQQEAAAAIKELDRSVPFTSASSQRHNL